MATGPLVAIFEATQIRLACNSNKTFCVNIRPHRFFEFSYLAVPNSALCHI